MLRSAGYSSDICINTILQTHNVPDMNILCSSCLAWVGRLKKSKSNFWFLHLHNFCTCALLIWMTTLRTTEKVPKTPLTMQEMRSPPLPSHLTGYWTHDIIVGLVTLGSPAVRVCVCVWDSTVLKMSQRSRTNWNTGQKLLYMLYILNYDKMTSKKYSLLLLL